MPLFTKRRRIRLSNHRTAQTPVGPIRISASDWPGVIVAVQVPQMPIVTVLPDRELGAMSIEKQPIPCPAPRRRLDPRRAARTRTALFAGRAYELRHTGLCTAQLRRDGAVIAEARGSLADYGPFRTNPGLDATLSWSPWVDPTDVAIGQSMVVAYGAGAPGGFASLIGFWLDSR
ncbi:hypothetical protein [Kitasatospora viridis]|uniref:Uncharacterized protein n=1 Tax=Kitasatospora viridis TaxID=281105 RepID=A0A561S953_9ACTN|nr:hypothetical protein [Kitasatospora viridis]TWF71402.1 hypothetical protein FHX73_1932 [Kitasatospora viridis]